MKRIGTLLASATAFVLWTAVPALADPCSGSACAPHVSGASGSSGAGGTAFTGANVSMGMLLVAVFLVLGGLALYASRRKLISTR